MGSGDVEAARRALGPVGAFLPFSMTGAVPAVRQRDAVRRLERAGYRATWVNEGIGKDAFVQVGVLLAATERMVVGTGIANIWCRAPQTMHAAASQIADAYPGRLVLGLGVGYPEQAGAVGAEFAQPLATIRRYVERMAEPSQMAAPEAAHPRILAARGPKMLALAGEISDGAMPAMVAPDATADARRALGPDRLLVVLIDGSADVGDPAAVVAAVGEHRDAGADHVVVSSGFGTDFAVGVDRLEALAPALHERG